MKEAVVSKAYAKSIYELGETSNVDGTSEFTQFTELINTSNDLETVLFSDAFTQDEKQLIVEDIFKKSGYSSLTQNSVKYLLNEQRMGLFPMIFKEMIVMDDEKKGFLRGTIEGSEDSISDDVANQLKTYLKKHLGGEPKLEYKKNENITGGYRVTASDLQLDATIDNQLNKLKNEILNS
jgi:F-type H+-transporting ATPase subunit delta